MTHMRIHTCDPSNRIKRSVSTLAALLLTVSACDGDEGEPQQTSSDETNSPPVSYPGSLEAAAGEQSSPTSLEEENTECANGSPEEDLDPPVPDDIVVPAPYSYPSVGQNDLEIEFSDSSVDSLEPVSITIVPDDTPAPYFFDRAGYHCALGAAQTTKPAGLDCWWRASGNSIDGFQIATEYNLDTQNRIELNEISVQTASGAAVGSRFSPVGGFAQPPGNCVEEAYVRFGPLPHDFPNPIVVPQITGYPGGTDPGECSWGQCSDLFLAHLRSIHGLWRMGQIFTIMENMGHDQRRWAWGRPGGHLDWKGDLESLGDWTKPEYYWGAYDEDRFDAIADFVHTHLTNLEKGEVDNRDIKWTCGGPGLCDGDNTYKAMTWPRGNTTFCSEMWDYWDSPTCQDRKIDGIARLVLHESMHLRKVDYGSYSAYIGDLHLHHHDPNSCVVTNDWFRDYGSPSCSAGWANAFSAASDHGVYELAHYYNQDDPPDQCGHRHDATQNIDNYVAFAEITDIKVRTEGFRWWPLPETSPEPPACQGTPECLCDDVGPGDAPDGDFAIDKFCDNNQNPDYLPHLVCRAESFQGQSYGVCEDCDEVGNRGPGCPCNDVQFPCNVGECWGDDTNGLASAVGTCFDTSMPPHQTPTWDCLADCDHLYGVGGWCAWNHDDRARCVPGGVGLPEAVNCWNDGSWIDPNTLECAPVGVNECEVSSDCQDVWGYPQPYGCVLSNEGWKRCVPIGQDPF
jgi:hypothetical protein